MTENYKKGVFKLFNSTTIQNKKNKYVNITVDAKKNLINRWIFFKGETNKDNMVGTWWNHEIVKAKAQISAISGRIIEQKVKFFGKEEIKINGKTYKTFHLILNHQIKTYQKIKN